MRRTIAIVLVGDARFVDGIRAVQHEQRSRTAGKPGSKSGPAMTKSGAGSANQSGTNPDQSNVKGMPGNKSGPPVKPPSQK